MGLLNKIGQKIENTMSKSLAGESKKQYEEAKEKREELKQEAELQKEEQQAMLQQHQTDAIAEDLGDMELLLQQIDVLDEKKIWIAGLEHYRLDTNPRFANMFAGKKVLRAVAMKGDMVYWCRFENGKFFAYQQHTKQDISYFEIVGVVEKDFRLETKDKKKIWLRVTKNKKMISQFRHAFK